MYKKSVRIITLVLIVALLLSTAALATENRASEYISSKIAYITSTGGGSINIYFDVIATGRMSTLGASVIKVYKSNGDMVKTFRSVFEGCEHMVASNVITYANYVTYDGVPGQSYYAVVTFYAADSTGSDSIPYTTSTEQA